MTSNMIAYITASEKIRNDKALENLRAAELAESRRHSTVIEDETKRHNYVSEMQNTRAMRENERANRANEMIKRDANSINNFNAQTNRQQVLIQSQSNWINAARQAEDARHNAFIEQETRRSNQAQEKLSAVRNLLTEQQNQISAINAMTNQINADTNRAGLEIQRTKNTIAQYEAETHRQGMYINAITQTLNPLVKVLP